MPSNIDAVIDDVGDVQEDLRDELRRSLAGAMRVLQADARTYIKQDADWRGHLSRSLSMDVERQSDGPKIVVSVGGPSAPYAPFVEFGTGSRTEETWKGSSNLAFEPSAYPPNFPYDEPDMSPGLVANIIEWVKTKPIVPEGEDMSQQELGYRIAATIAEEGTYAHPFMRPAWFHNEYQVRQAAQNALSTVTR